MHLYLLWIAVVVTSLLHHVFIEIVRPETVYKVFMPRLTMSGFRFQGTWWVFSKGDAA